MQAQELFVAQGAERRIADRLAAEFVGGLGEGVVHVLLLLLVLLEEAMVAGEAGGGRADTAAQRMCGFG